MVKSDFWEGKKVFLTGGTGFKGAWTILWLKLLGAEVVCYSQPPPTFPSLFELTGARDIVEYLEEDVRDYCALERGFSIYEPDIVIHMAAQSLVRRSYRDPLETLSTNVMGTANVLEAARKTASVKAAVIVTSDKCYENTGGRRSFVESDPMGGHDPYSCSKGCAELVTASYRNSFYGKPPGEGSGALAAAVRAGNVIGGGDWAEDRLIPDAMKAFAGGKPLMVRNPAAVRPWQFVLEPLRGYLMLAERLFKGEAGLARAWNFGPDESEDKPVSWIAGEISRHWGRNAEVKTDRGEHPHEAATLRLDWSLARRELGWSPVLNIEKALEWTVEWYKAQAAGGVDMRAFSERQIMNYSALTEA